MKRFKIQLGFALMLFLFLPALVSATTYVFPYEGFRYTVQSETETVLTQTNLSEHETFIKGLGTDVEAVLANYIANGIIMEVIPEDGGQIAVSVMNDPYLNAGKAFDELTDEEKKKLIERLRKAGCMKAASCGTGSPGQ